MMRNTTRRGCVLDNYPAKPVVEWRSGLTRGFAMALLALLLAGCSHSDDATTPSVPARPRSSAKPASPYTREYYQSLRSVGVQELKKKMRLGMKSEEVQDVLGNPTGH